MPRPPVPRRNNSIIPRAASPRTPSVGSPVQLPAFLASTENRKSSDSWTSSIDPRDEIESEWLPEQTKLLLRTLDALPSHLLTPFIGPVPPSNLLDKLAKGVVEAKSPTEWPHSVRKTRFKLVELARQRAKEAAQEGVRNDTIAEEDPSHRDVFQPTTNIGPKRPLHRQSSMDFMEHAKLDLGTTDPYSRALERLQRSPSRHRHSRSSGRNSVPDSHSLNPSTGSSTTLHSTRSARSSRSSLRRTASTLSISSTAPDWYVEPEPGPDYGHDDVASMERLRKPLKRAASFAISQATADKPSLKPRHVNSNNSLSGSDEEEKLRSMKAKKPRTKIRTSVDSPIKDTASWLHSPVDIDMTSPTRIPASSELSRRKSARTSGSKSTTTRKPSALPLQRPSNPTAPTAATPNATNSPQQPRGRRANLQRNPSIFGPELPNPQVTPSPPTSQYYTQQFASPMMLSPQSYASPALSPMNFSPGPRSPCTPARTRRLRPSVLRSPRRISFGSMIPHAEDMDIENAGETYGTLLLDPVEITTSADRREGENDRLNGGRGLGLDSAFQLR